VSAAAAEPFAAWAHHEGRCPECAFDWDGTDFEDLVGQCVRDVGVFGQVLSRIDPSHEVEPGLWSASRYVWHTVDVLRCGTERFWTLSADPAFGVPTFDENVLADTRGYDRLSPVVGLIALIVAADAWRTAALEAPHDVSTPHPEAGTIGAFDIVQRNAHEVCHHLWDIQRARPVPRPASDAANMGASPPSPRTPIR
jgi:hypothetical protein